MPRRIREYDKRAPDGVFCEGWRKVRKGGYVRVEHMRMYHPDLIKWVGSDVYCRTTDYWFTSVFVFCDSRRAYTTGANYICKAEAEKGEAR